MRLLSIDNSVDLVLPEAVKFPSGVQSQYLGILCALLYAFMKSNMITLNSYLGNFNAFQSNIASRS